MAKLPEGWEQWGTEPLFEAQPSHLVFEPEIGKETARIASIITGHDISKSKIGVKLLSFASNSHLEDYYVRNMAMLAVFDDCGVLDSYYSGEAINTYETKFRDTLYGWDMRLRRPSSTGLFKVVYIEDVNTHVGRQTVHYTAA